MKLKSYSFFSQFISVSIFFIFSFFSFGINSFEIKSASASNFQNLTPCKDSASFQKRLASSVKKLENRLKLYTPESKEATFLKNEIQATKTRFERYGNSSLLCKKKDYLELLLVDNLIMQMNF